KSGSHTRAFKIEQTDANTSLTSGQRPQQCLLLPHSSYLAFEDREVEEAAEEDTAEKRCADVPSWTAGTVEISVTDVQIAEDRRRNQLRVPKQFSRLSKAFSHPPPPQL
ncbi:hypothetical protein Q9L58_010580, partial [Maublancomyces gigas]